MLDSMSPHVKGMEPARAVIPTFPGRTARSFCCAAMGSTSARPPLKSMSSLVNGFSSARADSLIRKEACPEFNSLAANQEVWKTVPVPKCQHPVELVEPVERLHCHEAMALAAAVRLVILHFELPPTNEARCC